MLYKVAVASVMPPEREKCICMHAVFKNVWQRHCEVRRLPHMAASRLLELTTEEFRHFGEHDTPFVCAQCISRHDTEHWAVDEFPAELQQIIFC